MNIRRARPFGAELDAVVRKGFTLVELIVVTAVIAILISIALPAIQQVRAAARRTQCRSNLRNVSLAILQDMELKDRFPASANYIYAPGATASFNGYSWVVSILPNLDQTTLADKWDKNKPLDDPGNAALALTQIPVLTCPDDLSLGGQGDLSFVVNGGIGFTTMTGSGVGDCPISPSGAQLDLNSNGIACQAPETPDGNPTDRELFLRFGVFFIETVGKDVSRRCHRPGSVVDGMSHTYLLSENVRAGYDPEKPNDGHWAAVNAYRHSFFIGNPCTSPGCTQGTIDYTLANSGSSAINSGLMTPEGSSPVPNSFHSGGVNMAFCDGHVVFLSEKVDGAIYAAQASPQGARLNETRFAQPLVTD